MQTLFQDLRYGARQLLKRPGFTFLAIVSMALGIGANTAIFSLVDTVVFRPLPVKNPSELQELYGTLNNGADISIQSYLNYKDYRDRNQVFSGLIAYRITVASLSHNGNNERVWGMLASGNYFDVLGVPPFLGRGFLPEEDQTPKSHPVTVLSYGCWQKRFGSDPSIIGKTVSLNNVVFTVVGVAPKGFVGTEVAYRLVEPDHALLHEVVAVAAREEVRARLQPDEPGVLAKEDVERVTAAIPRTKDELEIFKLSLSFLRGLRCCGGASGHRDTPMIGLVVSLRRAPLARNSTQASR